MCFNKKKKIIKEYNSMIDYVRGMYHRVSLTHEDIESHLQKATDEELGNLISISKTVPPEERYPGYYIPGYRKFITRSFEKHPDKVYLLNKFDLVSLDKEFVEPPDVSNWKFLSFEEMNKDYYVFYYDDFGLPETHLCARAGYALYDPDIKDMVAYAFMWVS